MRISRRFLHGTSNVLAIGALNAQTPLAPYVLKRRPCNPLDVKIDIKYCGVCSSDMHQVRNEWGVAIYPMVPGHEIVGEVAEVGAEVAGHKVGDIVGVGVLVDSCGYCAQCEHGQQQYCEGGPSKTYNSYEMDSVTRTFGGYSSSIVVKEDFVLRIPRALPLHETAPLLCAGITTYSPMKRAGVRAGDRIGVVGLGGLGSMAVKFGKAFGAHVTVFTTSASKVELARSIGADTVAVIGGSTTPASSNVKGLSFILDTASATHDLNPYLSALGIGGRLVLVGLPETPHPSIKPGLLVSGGRSVHGSYIGGIPETQEMLDFCGQHNISCEAELIAAKDVEAAFAKLKRNEGRGRFVIDMSTLHDFHNPPPG